MRRVTVRYLVPGLANLVFLCSLHSAPLTGPPPLDVTVCDIAAKCLQFDQKRVRFRAEFISDGLENSSLVDLTKCSQGIQPWTSHAVDRHPDIQALDAALTKGQRGTFDKEIVATFTGRYECSSRTGRAPRVLRIESVEDLVVKPRKPESSDQPQERK